MNSGPGRRLYEWTNRPERKADIAVRTSRGPGGAGFAGVAGRRACAALAACSAVLHALSIGHATNLAVAAVMAAMCAVCLYCAGELWLRGTLRGWTVVAAMNLAMIVVHLPSPEHHHGGGVAGAASASGSTLMAWATALAAVEALIAAAVLFYRTRGMEPAGVSASS